MFVICLKCEFRVAVQWELPVNGCPRCGAREWGSTEEPKKPYVLSENDRLFLKSLRIAPEV